MDRVQKRFNELEEMAVTIRDSMQRTPSQRPSNVQQMGQPTRYIPTTKLSMDSELATQWQTSVKSLLVRVFGEDSPTYQEFAGLSRSSSGTIHTHFEQLHAVFRSARDDFDGGYLFDVRNLVHSEVIGDELDQAQYFLDEGDWKVPAAVIAGTVLESTLRSLCARSNILLRPKDTISPMNDALRKEDVYSQAVWRQIQAWSDIRNDAAHGHPDNFESNEVKRMIDGIRDFVVRHMI